MKKLLYKVVILSSPLFILLVIYFYKDPFKVLYHYNNYYLDTPHIYIHQEVVSTGTFTQNCYKNNYDSYIFGSSQSMFFKVNEWEKYINSKKCYHFDAVSESLFGIEKKVEYVHKKGLHINNAIFLFSYYTIYNYANDPAPKDPKITGDSKLNFQLYFLKHFFYSGYLKEYIYFLFTGKTFNPTIIFNNCSFKYNAYSNEYNYDWEQKIMHNTDSFYQSKAEDFYKRNAIERYSPSVIGQQQEQVLYKIKKILDEDHSNYRIVVIPLYDQLKIDSSDLKSLNKVFGDKNVFDFSGKNDITNDMHNYYEHIHFREQVANIIMKKIYINK